MEDQGGKPGVFVVADLDELRGEVGCESEAKFQLFSTWSSFVFNESVRWDFHKNSNHIM